MLLNYYQFITENIITGDGKAYWGNIGAGCLPFCTATKKFLGAFRSVDVLEPHCWGTWGGKIDDDEAIETTVTREFEEETQYTGVLDLIPLLVNEKKFKNGSTFTYHNFLALVPVEFTPTLDWETEAFGWLTWEELQAVEPKHSGLRELLADGPSKNKIESYL